MLTYFSFLYIPLIYFILSSVRDSVVASFSDSTVRREVVLSDSAFIMPLIQYVFCMLATARLGNSAWSVIQTSIFSFCFLNPLDQNAFLHARDA